ncbi:MAG: serine/threonine protein kinase, partial [Actinocatenispora sp.]
AKAATGSRRRMLWYVAALVVLVVVAGTLIGRQLLSPDESTDPRHRDAGAGTHTPGGHPGTTHSAASSPAASSPDVTSPPASPRSDVPAGFHRYHDRTGFSLAVPDGWSIEHDAQLLYVRDPHSSRYLMVDQTDQPKSDPVADWTRQEASRRSGWPGYHRIGIHSVDYFRTAADWEFTYDGDGGRRVHALNRGVVTGDHQAYGLFWSAPDSEWQSDLRYWHTFTATLHPAS